NDEDYPRDGRGYIIWPPDNATKLPITVRGTVRSRNIAALSMKDITWIDSRKKWYGILVSNDGKNFYGVDGKEDQPVRLDVEVEDGEQFVNYIRFELSSWVAWLVPPTVVTLITLIVFAVLYQLWKRYNEKKQQSEHLKWVEKQKYFRAIERRIQNIKQNEYLQIQLDAEKAALVPYRNNPSLPHAPKTVQIEDLGKIQFIRYDPDVQSSMKNNKNYKPIVIELTDNIANAHIISPNNEAEDQILLSQHSSSSSPTYLQQQQKQQQSDQWLTKHTDELRKKINSQEQKQKTEKMTKDIQESKQIFDINEYPKLELKQNQTHSQEFQYSSQFWEEQIGENEFFSNSTAESDYITFLQTQTASPGDFSMIPEDSPDILGVEWGDSGIPATLGLISHGFNVPTPELIELQMEQEQQRLIIMKSQQIQDKKKKIIGQNMNRINKPNLPKQHKTSGHLTPIPEDDTEYHKI
ncbi:MAG: hypothetical protein EZS28_030518, partial [Streblomastix strix]